MSSFHKVLLLVNLLIVLLATDVITELAPPVCIMRAEADLSADTASDTYSQS